MCVQLRGAGCMGIRGGGRSGGGRSFGESMEGSDMAHWEAVDAGCFGVLLGSGVRVGRGGMCCILCASG